MSLGHDSVVITSFRILPSQLHAYLAADRPPGVRLQAEPIYWPRPICYLITQPMWYRLTYRQDVLP